MALALDEPYQGRKCILRLGTAGSDDTVILFTGEMNTMDMEDFADTAKIILKVDHDLIILDREVVRTYTKASQQSRFPSDTAFNFVTELSVAKTWGAKG